MTYFPKGQKSLHFQDKKALIRRIYVGIPNTFVGIPNTFSVILHFHINGFTRGEIMDFRFSIKSNS
jgi:hypothetical protein